MNKPISTLTALVIALCICAVLVGGTTSEQTPIYTSEAITACRASESITEPVTMQHQTYTYVITAYCPCEKCCGKWARERAGGVVRGATGIELKAGISCAAPLPMGTKVHIDGIGTFTVQDRTADWIADKYDNRIIDIYFDSHEEAERFGKRIAEVEIQGGIANE